MLCQAEMLHIEAFEIDKEWRMSQISLDQDPWAHPRVRQRQEVRVGEWVLRLRNRTD